MQFDGKILIIILKPRTTKYNQQNSEEAYEKKLCVCVVLHNRATWFLANVWHHVCLQGPSEPGQKLIVLKKKKSHRMRQQKKQNRKIKSEERQKQLAKGAQSVVLPALGVKKKVGKEKQVYRETLGKVLSFLGQLRVLLWD